MSVKDLAREFMSANPKPKKKGLGTRRKEMAASSQHRKGRTPIFKDSYDRVAFDRWRYHENKFTKAGEFSLRAFLEDNVNFRFDCCLYVPFYRKGMPASVAHNGRRMPASRAMCLMAHGAPSDPSDVARHLCGNGHLSCVNPRHLAWGTQEQNGNDAHLHRVEPTYMPDIEDEILNRIKEDRRHVNVIAVLFDVPSAIVRRIKSG